MCEKMTKKQPVLFAISGVKNSGKTTLMIKLISILTAKGLNVATIKHDGHEFEVDVPGTDTYKHFKAGAYGTAIFSGTKCMVVKKQENLSEKELIKAFPKADIILLEGFKHSSYPKFEVIRKGISEKMVCKDESVIGVVSDFVPDIPPNIALYDLNNVELIAEIILDKWFAMTQVTLIVLAGGMSSRMGQDKADMYYRNRSFLEIQVEKGHVIGISDIIVSGYKGKNCEEKIVKDNYDQKGPLGGLEACLQAAEHAYCLVISIDMPLISIDELEKLIHVRRKSRKKAVVLMHADKLEPLIGIYSVDLLKAVKQEIMYGKGSVFSLLKKEGYDVYESDAPEEMFRNVNTMEEYDKMLFLENK